MIYFFSSFVLFKRFLWRRLTNVYLIVFTRITVPILSSFDLVLYSHVHCSPHIGDIFGIVIGGIIETRRYWNGEFESIETSIIRIGRDDGFLISSDNFVGRFPTIKRVPCADDFFVREILNLDQSKNVSSVRREGHGFYRYGLGVVTCREVGEIRQNDGTGIHFWYRTKPGRGESDCMGCFGSQKKTDAFELCLKLNGFSLNRRTVGILNRRTFGIR